MARERRVLCVLDEECLEGRRGGEEQEVCVGLEEARGGKLVYYCQAWTKVLGKAESQHDEHR